MSAQTFQHILILTKFRFIGDTLLAVPLFRAARARWPQARITLLTGTKSRILLENTPYLDEVIDFDPYERDQGLRVYLQLLRRLRRDRFDLTLTLNRTFHSALTPWLTGAPVRAGSRAEWRSPLLTHRLDYDHEKSEIACHFDVLRAVAPDVSLDPTLELWLTETERREARQRLQGVFGARQSLPPLLGIQPGASNPSKQWDPARFAAVADALLAAAPDHRLVLLGGPDERPAAAAMLARIDSAHVHRTADFVGALDLRSSLAMISQLSHFVGGDTALRHIAVAFDVPSVALFGPTNPRKWGGYGGCHRQIESPDGTMAGIGVHEVTGLVRPQIIASCADMVAAL